MGACARGAGAIALVHTSFTQAGTGRQGLWSPSIRTVTSEIQQQRPRRPGLWAAHRHNMYPPNPE